MKITVEISDEEVIETAKEIVTKRIADKIMGEFNNYNSARNCYRTVIKECVREAIKQDIDNLSDRAIEAAGKSIENRAVKKLIGKLEKEL